MLLLILCVLLPLQGFAVWQGPVSPCPMQDMMVMPNEAGETADTLAEAMKDCCNDVATFERTGQPCKSPQSCAAAGMATLLHPVVLTPVTLDPQAPIWRCLPPGATSRLWRPPASA